MQYHLQTLVVYIPPHSEAQAPVGAYLPFLHPLKKDAGIGFIYARACCDT